MKQVQQHLELLGKKAEDKVTGFKGVITTVSFDLYGCIQVILDPPIKKDGSRTDGKWFDVSRLNVTGKIPVMVVPNFAVGDVAEGKQGPAEKPPMSTV